MKSSSLQDFLWTDNKCANFHSRTRTMRSSYFLRPGATLPIMQLRHHAYYLILTKTCKQTLKVVVLPFKNINEHLVTCYFIIMNTGRLLWVNPKHPSTAVNTLQFANFCTAENNAPQMHHLLQFEQQLLKITAHSCFFFFFSRTKRSTCDLFSGLCLSRSKLGCSWKPPTGCGRQSIKWWTKAIKFILVYSCDLWIIRNIDDGIMPSLNSSQIQVNK